MLVVKTLALTHFAALSVWSSLLVITVTTAIVTATMAPCFVRAVSKLLLVTTTSTTTIITIIITTIREIPLTTALILIIFAIID